MTILRNQLFLLFGYLPSGERILLAVGDSQREVFDLALEPATHCNGRFTMLAMESFEGLDFAQAAASSDDAALNDADALIARVMKAVKP